jgi:hypothetical protein
MNFLCKEPPIQNGFCRSVPFLPYTEVMSEKVCSAAVHGADAYPVEVGVLVPAENATEAAAVEGLYVISIRSFWKAPDFLEG